MIMKTKLSWFPKIVIGTVLIITALFVLTGIKKIIYERIRFVEAGFSTMDTFDFSEHWNSVAAVLQWNEEGREKAKIEDLRIIYDISNKIETFKYTVLWEEAQGKRYASVYFNSESGKFEIQAHEREEWPQYVRLIPGERVFDLLAETKISDLYLDMNKDYPPSQKLEFYGLALGELNSVAFVDGNIFVLEGSKVVPFTGILPVEAGWIKVYDHVRMGETSGGPTQGNYYLFDVKQN